MRRGEVERLRRELDRQSRRRERRRYPADLRGEAVAYARRQQELGVTIGETAAELGLRARTLHKWMRDTVAGPARFQRVELMPGSVVEPRFEATRAKASVGAADTRAAVRASKTSLPSRTTLIVTTPGGMRIEGLDLDGVVSLIARVG